MASSAKLSQDTHDVLDSTDVSTTATSTLDEGDLDVYQLLHAKNIEFFTSLAPTLAFIFLLLLSGLVGNTIVFFVYYKRFKSSVTRSFILAMSVCDLLTNVLSLPTDVLEIRFHNTFEADWACKLSRTVKSCLSFTSACILVAVAVDRYRKMCRPYSTPTTCRHVRVILVTCIVIALGITLPYTVLTGSQTVRFEGTNITGSKCSIDDAYVKSSFLVIYNVITGVTFIVCVIAMVVCYVGIARQLWLHKRQAGVSVTGRAVSWRGDGHGSRANLHEFHTYTDEETSPDKLDQSSTEVKAVCDSSERPPASEDVCGKPAETSLSETNKADSRYTTEEGSRCTTEQSYPNTTVASSSKTSKASTSSDNPSADAQDTSDSSPHPHCALEPPTENSNSPDIVAECRSSAAEIGSDSDQTNTVLDPLNNNTNLKSNQPPGMESVVDPAGFDGYPPVVSEGRTEVREDDHTKQSHTYLHHEDSCGAHNPTPTIMITDAPEDCGDGVWSTAIAKVQPENAASETAQREELEVPSSKPSHKMASLAHSITSSFRSLRHNSSFSLARRKSNPRSRRSVRKIPTRTTLMMFVLTAIFIVNYLPYLLIVSSRVHDELLVEKLGLNVYHVILRSYFINSAVNPLVYSFCSARFRQECRRLFNCR